MANEVIDALNYGYSGTKFIGAKPNVSGTEATGELNLVSEAECPKTFRIESIGVDSGPDREWAVSQRIPSRIACTVTHQGHTFTSVLYTSCSMVGTCRVD